MKLKGTWTTKDPPKTLQTILGLLLILVIIAVGLLSRGANAGRTEQSPVRTLTTAPSQTPSPHR